MKSDTFTTKEETRIYKGYHGWKGETFAKVNGRNWVINTSKCSSGVINSDARAVNDNGGGAYSFSMFTDDKNEHFTLINTRANATEKAIRDQHTKALLLFDERVESTPELIEKPYEITRGQILFTDSCGNFEEKPRAVCEIIREGQYKSVFLDGSGFRHDDYVKDIRKKFGIGVYYKEGERIEEDKLNELCISAHENETRRRASEQTAAIEANALKSSQIEAGAAVIPSIPSWATHVIIGCLQVDDSDIQTDYFSSHTEKTIYLAFSSHKRDLFEEMRRAADNSPETIHLGTANTDKDIEHREKYSMGSGYYLGSGRYSGWQIEKCSLSTGGNSYGVTLAEIQRGAGDGRYFIPSKSEGPLRF